MFVARGYRVPLSAIAREAGVGQGVLYRHFRTRTDLAVAVFRDNVEELRLLAAARPEPEGLLVVWRRLVEFTLEAEAFVAALTDADAPPTWQGDRELEQILAAPLERAQGAGLVAATLTPHDLVNLTRAPHGLIATAGPADPASDVDRLFGLVDPALALG